MASFSLILTGSPCGVLRNAVGPNDGESASHRRITSRAAEVLAKLDVSGRNNDSYTGELSRTTGAPLRNRGDITLDVAVATLPVIGGGVDDRLMPTPPAD